MRETSIGFKPSEIINAYHKEDYNAIFRYVSSAADELKNNYRIKDYSVLQGNFNTLKNAFLFLRKEEETNESIGYLVGYISGILRAVEEFTFSEEFKLERLMKEKKDHGIDDIPHINEILKELSKTTEIRHGILADKIGIDKSTLTPIMEKLDSFGLTSFSRIGNRKYYYLMPLGKSYLNHKIHNETEETRKDKTKLSPAQALYAQQVLDSLEQSEKTDAVKRKMEVMEDIFNRENVYLDISNSENMVRVESAEFRNMSYYGYNFGYQLRINQKVNKSHKQAITE